LVDGGGWGGVFVDGRSIGEEELTNSRGQIKKVAVLQKMKGPEDAIENDDL